MKYLYIAFGFVFSSIVLNFLPLNSGNSKVKQNTISKTTTAYKKLEVFTINQTKENVIVTYNKTKIIVPRNCFVAESGEMPANVKIEISEFNSCKNILLNKLQTNTEFDTLQSSFIIKIEANDTKKNKLKLKQGKRILIDSQAQFSYKNLKVFRSSDIQNISWEPYAYLEKEMILIPKDSFNYDRYTKKRYINNYIDGYIGLIVDCYFIKFYMKDEKLDDTFLYTREFYNRLYFISFMQGFYSIISDAGFTSCYTENTDKPIYYCDSLFFSKAETTINEFVKRGMTKNEFELRSFYKVDKNGKPLERIDHKIDSAKHNKMALSNGIFHNSFVNEIRRLSKLGSTKVIKLNNYGINLTKQTAYKELQQKGLSEAEIDKTIQLYLFQKTIIKDIKSKKIDNRDYFHKNDVKKTQNGCVIKNSSKLYYTFYINDLGTYTVASKYKKDKDKLCNLTIDLKKRNKYPLTFVAMIADSGLVISSGEIDKNKFTFNGLPKDVLIDIIIYGNKNDKEMSYGYIQTTLESIETKKEIKLQEISSLEFIRNIEKIEVERYDCLCFYKTDVNGF